MPRPLKASRELRQRFDLYLDEREVGQIRASAEAARLPMSTFLRRVALRQKLDPAPSAANLKHWREIARACNAGLVSEGIYPVVTELAEQVRLLRLELLGVKEGSP
jgi:hypothetical protein